MFTAPLVLNIAHVKEVRVIFFVVFQVVEADIFSADSLKTHFKGQDVIMSCLGFPISTFSAVTGYTQSMNAMISAMREAQVSRIITMTSWYTERKSCTRDAFSN